MPDIRKNHEEVLKFSLTKGIITPKLPKANYDVARAINTALAYSNVSIERWKEAYTRDEMFDPIVFITPGAHFLYDFIVPEFIELAKELYTLRPTGLHTPNQAPGEGELMAVVLSPRVKLLSGSGDIQIGKEAIELKGEAPRLQTNKTGNQVRIECDAIAQRFGVSPNPVQGNRTAVELWDNSVPKVAHWQKQLSTLSPERALEFVLECVGSLGAPVFKDQVSRSMNGTVVNVPMLQRELCKSIFSSMKRDWKFYAMVLNGQVRVITNDVENFNKLIDEGVIRPNNPYIRMFQNNCVGFYIC